jgi:hypothetical protein
MKSIYLAPGEGRMPAITQWFAENPPQDAL